MNGILKYASVSFPAGLNLWYLKCLRSILSVFLFFAFVILPSCVSSAAKAEEYYAMGMAYFELKKYPEAENYLNKAKFHPAVKAASEYYLGRIAYEAGRYKEAENYFERIIKEDEENITALKAAAYTCIKLEELDKAEMYYQRILSLVPESYDEGYNYAMVLMALDKAEDAEAMLIKYNNIESAKALFVLARARQQQGKPEAADTYNASLSIDDDPFVRSEYAAYLVEQGFLEKGLEEYKKALENTKLAAAKKGEITKAIAALEGNGENDDESKNDNESKNDIEESETDGEGGPKAD